MENDKDEILVVKIMIFIATIYFILMSDVYNRILDYIIYYGGL